MQLLEYALLAISSLFVIIDPIALVPIFLAMTGEDTPQQRIRTARLAFSIAAGVLMVFALVGKWIFQFLGITLPAFQMAACIVLLLVALDMLRAQRSRVQETEEETEAGAAKEDIAVTPLAVPMLAGPGAISTVILLHSRAANVAEQIALFVAIPVVCLVGYAVLHVSAHGARWLTPLIVKIVTRLMGLLLAAIAFQFLISALRELGVIRA